LHWPKLSVKRAEGCRSRLFDGACPAKCWNNRGLRYSAITVAHAVRFNGAGEPGSPRIRTGVQRCRDRSICISGPLLSSRTTQSRVVDYR